MGSGNTVVSIENKSIYKWTHTVQTQRVQGSTEPLWNYTLTCKGIADWELLDEKYKIEEIFIRNSPVTQKVMRGYVERHNLVEYKCNKCGCDGHWQDGEIAPFHIKK